MSYFKKTTLVCFSEYTGVWSRRECVWGKLTYCPRYPGVKIWISFQYHSRRCISEKFNLRGFWGCRGRTVMILDDLKLLFAFWKQGLLDGLYLRYPFILYTSDIHVTHPRHCLCVTDKTIYTLDLNKVSLGLGNSYALSWNCGIFPTTSEKLWNHSPVGSPVFPQHFSLSQTFIRVSISSY